MIVTAIIIIIILTIFFVYYNNVVECGNAEGGKVDDDVEIVKSVCVTKVFNPKCIKFSNLPLKSHQELLVKHIMTHRGLLAIHAVGSGKTLSAVTASQCFLKKYPDKRVVVVTPKSLQENFIKEMYQYDPQVSLSKYTFYTVDGFAQKHNEIKCKNIMLIIDEAHNLRTEIKNNTGMRSLCLINCAKSAFKVLLLSATPIINGPYDLVNLISMVDGTTNIDKKQFSQICDDPKKFKDYFKCKISIFTPNKKETEAFYPRSRIHEIFIQMTYNYERKYLEVENNMSDEKIFQNPKIFYNGVRRASNKIDSDRAAPKIRWIRNFFNEHVSGKCVIFSHWLESGIMTIILLLTKLKIKHMYIDGSMSIHDRKEAVNQYNSNNIRVLLISKAGGEGLDLKETRYMILLEPGWNPAISEQVIGRGIRFKSHYHLPPTRQLVDVYRLYLVKRTEIEHLDTLVDTKKKWSVDLYLRALSIDKKHIINNIMEQLSTHSIENNNCS
jgi:SNF2 family DNA or RNA helicase